MSVVLSPEWTDSILLQRCRLGKITTIVVFDVFLSKATLFLSMTCLVYFSLKIMIIQANYAFYVIVHIGLYRRFPVKYPYHNRLPIT